MFYSVISIIFITSIFVLILLDQSAEKLNDESKRKVLNIIFYVDVVIYVLSVALFFLLDFFKTI